MSRTTLRVENVWKQYRYGAISHRTINQDLQSWWARLRGKDDPNLKIGQSPRPRNPSDGSRFWALKDVSFEVPEGQILGIIGRNGAGKSTLLKILSRVTAPTRGQVKMRGRSASLLEVGIGFHPELTGRENIHLNGSILGMSKDEIRKRFDQIVAFAEIEDFIDTPVKRYSSGMYVRLAFAVAAHLDPEILIIDEVLAVGDYQFQKKCLGRLDDVAKSGRTVLFVSHNMTVIRQFTQRCILLDEGAIKSMGPTEDAISGYISSQKENTQLGVRQPIENLKTDRRALVNPKVKFRELGLRCAEPQLRTGSELVVETLLETVSPCSNIAFGFTIEDDMGNAVIGGYSPTFSLETPGLHQVDLAIRDLRLAPGNYSIGIAIVQGGLAEVSASYDIVLRFAAFEVHPFLHTGQPLHWLPEWGRYVHTHSSVSIRDKTG